MANKEERECEKKRKGKEQQLKKKMKIRRRRMEKMMMARTYDALREINKIAKEW